MRRSRGIGRVTSYGLTCMREALTGANQVTSQERLEKRYPGLVLPFLGFSDFQGGGRVAEATGAGV